ncbi:MAG: YfiR family protein [Pseudomonadota bacterium]
MAAGSTQFARPGAVRLRCNERQAVMQRGSRMPAQLLTMAVLLLGMRPTARASAPVQATPQYSEYEVKAEFIERFTRFVVWPESVFASGDSPFVVCVWGSGLLATHLERVVARGKVKDRPARLVHVGPDDGLDSCHILFVSVADRIAVRSVMARTRGKPILSVAEQPGFAEAGVLINLIIDDEGAVRFEINRDVANASGLKISAKLMRLARVVRER